MDLRIVLILIFGLVHGSLSAPQKQSNSLKDKGADSTKAKILKQINTVNKDGSYTFGYEADDGSFKVETRSKDGVVKGKYGFLDPAGKLKTVEYTAGESASKSRKDDDDDQTMAGATTDAKTVKGSSNDDDDEDKGAEQQAIERRQDIGGGDGGRDQYLRQVTSEREEQPQTYNPTTQLPGGRFTGEQQPQYQFDGQSQYPQQQFLGGGGGSSQFGGGSPQFGGNPQQYSEDDGSSGGGFSPNGGGRFQSFVGSQPSQLGNPIDFSQYSQQQPQQPQYSGLDREAQLIQQGFSGPRQPYQQQQSPLLINSPQNPYIGSQQQQYLGQLSQGGQQYNPQQFSGGFPQQGGAGGVDPSQLVGGIGRPDLQNFPIDPPQYSRGGGGAGAGQVEQQSFGGPNRFSSSGANELGFSSRPTSLGSGGSTQEYVPSVELEGFSEDVDQDGYVDALPGSRNGDARTAQAAEKTAAVKTPDGERVNPNQYNPQVLGPQQVQQQQQQQHFPQGIPIQGGQGGGLGGGVSPYDEQTLQQIYAQQGLGGQGQFPGSAQPNFQIQPQGQFQGQSPYQGQGIIGSPYQGQGIIGGQSPYQGQGFIGGQSLFQGQGILAQPPQSSFQGQGQGQGQGIPFQGGSPQFQIQGNPEFQGGSGPSFQSRPQFQAGGGQPQFSPQSPQQQQQFSPEQFQGQGLQAGPPQQFFGGSPQGIQGSPQGGPYVVGGGGFPGGFPGHQGGPIPPQYFQGGRGQQFSPSPYSGGIQSGGFPFDYSPYYGGIGQGGFQGGPGYPQIPGGQGRPGPIQGQGQAPGAASASSDKADDEAAEKKA